MRQRIRTPMEMLSKISMELAFRYLHRTSLQISFMIQIVYEQKDLVNERGTARILAWLMLLFLISIDTLSIWYIL